MHAISSHSHENRMTPSAVAACMAPLLLRPLLAGECELDDDFDINGDNSTQLIAAANAANNAQAIITTLLEEYENVFDVRHCIVGLYIVFLLFHKVDPGFIILILSYCITSLIPINYSIQRNVLGNLLSFKIPFAVEWGYHGLSEDWLN